MRFTKRKGVALIAAIGVLATLFVMVGAVAVTSRILYEQNHNDIVRTEIALLLESGAHKIRHTFLNQQLAEPREMFIKLQDHNMSVRLEPLSEDDELYRTVPIKFKEGDVRITVTTHYPADTRTYTASKRWLINLSIEGEGLLALSDITFQRGEEKT